MEPHPPEMSSTSTRDASNASLNIFDMDSSGVEKQRKCTAPRVFTLARASAEATGRIERIGG